MATHPYPIHIASDVLRIANGEAPLVHDKIDVYFEDFEFSIVSITGIDNDGNEIFETAQLLNGNVYWQSFEIVRVLEANHVIGWPFGALSVSRAVGMLHRSTMYVGSEYCTGPAALLSHDVGLELSLEIPDA